MPKFDPIKLFKFAQSHIPAYQKLLRKNKINPAQIKTLGDFLYLPITEKKSYIYKNKTSDLFSMNTPPMIYASSGSSGKPTFWFRGDKQELHGADLHERIFSKIFGIKKSDKTLVVICFSMGVWIAGNFTLACCRELSRRGYNISVVSPGVEMEDIMSSLSNIAPLFKKVVLAGYPPFLMNVAVEARKRKIKLAPDIKAITAGDKFSETWRNDFLATLGIKNKTSIVSIYGSADAGPMAHETPLSIFLRNESLKNKKLYNELFGDAKTLPGLVQYDSGQIFFEEIDGELVLTADTAIPLIRYNIHDTGRIIHFKEIKKIISRAGLTDKISRLGLSNWQMPFLTLKGRTDVAVTFYAINIFPENISSAIKNKNVSGLLTGNYRAYNTTAGKSRFQKLIIELEPAGEIKNHAKTAGLISKTVHSELVRSSIEFRKLNDMLGEKSMPVILLKKFDGSSSKQKNGPTLIALAGKKPRLT
ncbi:MAG: hypothetical protein Q8Q06_01310 [bacterium]|nr:hypothetical protein [bacterium]